MSINQRLDLRRGQFLTMTPQQKILTLNPAPLMFGPGGNLKSGDTDYAFEDNLARRTAAQYREAMKIPTSIQRRRLKNKAK